MLRVFVVSDATGETAERMMRSALTQFKDVSVSVIRRGRICTEEQVSAVVREAAGQDSIIAHTFVSNNLRGFMLSESRLHGVNAMDLMGPVLDRLANQLKLTPQQIPGLFKHLLDAKSRHIEAVEFAFLHDDGQHAEELDQAEIVLVGPSRTMKTPTTLYLAYRGWFVGNVPLVPEIALPPKLVSLSPKQVFCFSMDAIRLQELRMVRSEHQKIPMDPYATLGQISKELHHSRQLGSQYNWHQIDVTGKSVEELAMEITSLLPKNVSNLSDNRQKEDEFLRNFLKQ